MDNKYEWQWNPVSGWGLVRRMEVESEMPVAAKSAGAPAMAGISSNQAGGIQERIAGLIAAGMSPSEAYEKIVVPMQIAQTAIEKASPSPSPTIRSPRGFSTNIEKYDKTMNDAIERSYALEKAGMGRQDALLTSVYPAAMQVMGEGWRAQEAAKQKAADDYAAWQKLLQEETKRDIARQIEEQRRKDAKLNEPRTVVVDIAQKATPEILEQQAEKRYGLFGWDWTAKDRPFIAGRPAIPAYKGRGEQRVASLDYLEGRSPSLSRTNNVALSGSTPQGMGDVRVARLNLAVQLRKQHPDWSRDDIIAEAMRQIP